MCGIAGALSPGGVDGDALEAMNAALVHRGPDDAGVYSDGDVGLAHRRLAIVDPEGGHQPMFNEDRSVAVVFNGEIYNYQRLRERLSGHHFESETDTEVLVHAYEEFGRSVLDVLDGMFAFALWDVERERLLLARDRMGIKPLYVADGESAVAFASELAALHEGPVDNGGLDRNGVASYFAFGYVPAPETVFQNISKLRPGERVLVEDGRLDRDLYYRPTVEAVDDDYETATTTLRAKLETAVQSRLQADVPLGAFLSGGIDSSIVVGLLADVMDEPVKTFSVGFGKGRFDERWAASTVAEYHDTDHHEYRVGPGDVRDIIPEVVGSMGQPFADASVLPTTIVSRETSAEVTVAHSGDGADELFAGYNKYRGEYYGGYYRALPKALRRSLLAPAVNRLPASRESTVGERSRQLQKFVRGDETDTARRQFQWMAITTAGTTQCLPSVDPTTHGTERVRAAQQAASEQLPASRQDDLAVMGTTDTRFALPDGILSKVDRASMLHSLEVRVPFLDTAVVEYAAGLPTSYKITPRKRKRILKAACRDLLPEAILTRGKQGFEVPVGEWFKAELADEFVDTIERLDSETIDTRAVMAVYREHCDGRADHTNFLWSVFVYATWYQRMVETGVLAGRR
jgi:asparagine synthase (glutamine-hydrolysing)